MGADGYSDGSDDNNRDIDHENDSIEVSGHFNDNALLKYNVFIRSPTKNTRRVHKVLLN